MPARNRRRPGSSVVASMRPSEVSSLLLSVCDYVPRKARDAILPPQYRVHRDPRRTDNTGAMLREVAKHRGLSMISRMTRRHAVLLGSQASNHPHLLTVHAPYRALVSSSLSGNTDRVPSQCAPCPRFAVETRRSLHPRFTTGSPAGNAAPTRCPYHPGDRADEGRTDGHADHDQGGGCGAARPAARRLVPRPEAHPPRAC